MLDCISSKKMDYQAALRSAFLSEVLDGNWDPRDPESQEFASSIDVDININLTESILLLPLSVREIFADLIVGESPHKIRPERLLVSATLAAYVYDLCGKDFVLEFMNEIGPSYFVPAFQDIVNKGVVDIESTEKFIELQKSLIQFVSPLKEESSKETETPVETDTSCDGFSDEPQELTREDLLFLAQDEIDSGKLTSSSEFKKEWPALWEELLKIGAHKELNYFEEKSELPPVPQNFSAEELRSLDADAHSLTEEDVYRLISIKCFKLCTPKPMIGKIYTSTILLQSNLLKTLKEKCNRQLFNKCWRAMCSSNAILEHKAKDSVSSLNQKTDEITDPAIQDAVGWALMEHRRIMNGN